MKLREAELILVFEAPLGIYSVPDPATVAAITDEHVGQLQGSHLPAFPVITWTRGTMVGAAQEPRATFTVMRVTVHEGPDRKDRVGQEDVFMEFVGRLVHLLHNRFGCEIRVNVSESNVIRSIDVASDAGARP